MTDYITETVTARGIVVFIIGGVLMQSEMIRRDPFQRAVPCFDWTPEAWKAVEWADSHYGLAFRVVR